MFSKKISVRCLILFVTVFIGSVAYAAPVLQRDVVFTQADGSSFVATPYGDEWDSGYETKAGFTILFNEWTGNWVYADRAADGSLKRTDIVVNKGMPKMSEHLRPLLPAKSKERQSQGYDALYGPVRLATGNQRALVILVQFVDRTLMTTEDEWADLMFNEIAFSSVKHYFRVTSYNNMDLLPASESYGTANNGVVIVTLPYNHPDTAGNIGVTNLQITSDALVAVDPYVDFAAFDIDGNGYLSTDELHVVIIVAGYETAYGGPSSACSPSVWAHSWYFFDIEPPTLDGKLVAARAGHGAYIQQGEWHCATMDNPGHMATMGTIAHEFGHDLWLPDEYDIDGSSQGIGKWGLMGSGCWNNCSGGYSGNCPSHPIAWDKWYLNWLTPTQITEAQTVTVNIPDIETNPTVYQLRENPYGVDWSFEFVSGTGEYFLLENRQLTGYNAGLPGSGLLIWHIYERASQYNDANMNESGNRLVALEEADALNQLDRRPAFGGNRGDAGDPFPGTSNNTVFDFTSDPSSKLYFNYLSGVSVTNISASGYTMTATLSVDTTIPTGTITINSDATYTNSTSVTLTLNCNDRGGSGCAEMRFNDSDINDPMHFWYRWSEWESYTTSKAWTFTSGVVGNKTVYVQFKDNMGNEGAGYSDTIILTRPFINYILGVKEPGLIVSIIGQNFGKTQVDSIVHIGPKAFDSSSPRIKLWSDAKIKIRLPNYQCGWFQGQDYRYIRVWVTIDGVDSNKRRIKIIKPDTCP